MICLSIKTTRLLQYMAEAMELERRSNAVTTVKHGKFLQVTLDALKNLTRDEIRSQIITELNAKQ